MKIRLNLAKLMLEVKHRRYVMTEQIEKEENCCKNTCCADGCCSDGCVSGNCSSTCCADGCCSEKDNCCEYWIKLSVYYSYFDYVIS